MQDGEGLLPVSSRRQFSRQEERPPIAAAPATNSQRSNVWSDTKLMPVFPPAAAAGFPLGDFIVMSSRYFDQLLRPTAGPGRPQLIGVGLSRPYFDPPDSFRFVRTSSKLKPAAFWRCG